MGIEEMIKTIMGYGAMGICLGYFIYKDNTTMKDLRKLMHYTLTQDILQNLMFKTENIGNQ